MSWNGRDIVYQVSPAVMHRNLQELLSVPKFVGDIYNEIRNKGITSGSHVIEIRQSEFAKLSHSWRKSKRLFGVNVVINDSIGGAYRIIEVENEKEFNLRSRTESCKLIE